MLNPSISHNLKCFLPFFIDLSLITWTTLNLLESKEGVLRARILSRETKLSSQETRLSSRESLKNCKWGCLNFSRDFNSLLLRKLCRDNAQNFVQSDEASLASTSTGIPMLSPKYHVHKRCNSWYTQPIWFENGICEYLYCKFFYVQSKIYRSWLPRCSDLFAEIASFAHRLSPSLGAKRTPRLMKSLTSLQ